MNDKSKKLAVGSILAAATIITVPIVVSSCGLAGEKAKAQSIEEVRDQVSQEKSVVNDAKSETIKVGVRTSEFATYKKLAEKFNSYGKGKVKIEPTDQSSFKDLYDTKAASNSMPTAFVNDSNSMSVITNSHKWATAIIPEDFLGAKNKAIYDVTDGEEDFTNGDLNASHLKASSDSRNVVYGLPVGYGTKGLAMNTTMLDQTKSIKSFVPYAKGSNANTKEVEYKGAIKHKTFGKCSPEEIQKYISEAGDKTAESSVVVPATDVASAWLGYGPGNTMQRIYSVARSCLSDDALDANVMSLALKEGFANFGVLASSGITQDGAKIYDTNKKMLVTKDFDKIMGGKHFNKKLSDYLWTSFGGYMTGGPASIINSDYLTKEPKQGEVEPFFNKQTLFTWNAKWAARMANEQWSKPSGSKNNSYKKSGINYSDGKGYSSGQMDVLSSPYGEVTGDSISISVKAKPVQRLVAKRWFKFLLQSKAKFIIPTFTEGKDTFANKTPGELIAIKTVSSLKQVRTIQKNSIKKNEKSWKDAWFNYGMNEKGVSSDEYNGINGQVWKITDSNNLSGLYEPALINEMQSFYKAGKSNMNAWSRSQFNSKLDNSLKTYNEQLALK